MDFSTPSLPHQGPRWAKERKKEAGTETPHERGVRRYIDFFFSSYGEGKGEQISPIGRALWGLKKAGPDRQLLLWDLWSFGGGWVLCFFFLVRGGWKEMSKGQGWGWGEAEGTRALTFVHGGHRCEDVCNAWQPHRR